MNVTILNRFFVVAEPNDGMPARVMVDSCLTR